MTPWANAAINNELNVIREMPPHNINRRGNCIFLERFFTSNSAVSRGIQSLKQVADFSSVC